MNTPEHEPIGANSLPKRAVLYVRALTLASNIENELQPLREEYARRSWPIYHEFHDITHIGKHKSWPGLDALMAAAKNRKFDVLVVRNLAALGRCLSHLIGLVSELLELGIDIVAVDDRLDTALDGRDRIVAILAALAKADNLLHQEKSRAGYENYRQAAKRIGRPPKYDRNSIIELQNEGKTRSEIAEALKMKESALRYYLDSGKKRRN